MKANKKAIGITIVILLVLLIVLIIVIFNITIFDEIKKTDGTEAAVANLIFEPTNIGLFGVLLIIVITLAVTAIKLVKKRNL